MAEPTLMFCVGATKAGTSWLHRYLSDHPECHMRGIKELHYFDAVEFDDWVPWIRDVTRQRDGARAPQVAADAADWLAVLEARTEDDAAYLAYLKKGRSDEKLVGDVTPAYGLLPQARLAQMARLGPDVRFVYLLADPVMRLWSHVRMIAARARGGAGDIAARAADVLRRVFAGKEPEIVRRSDYIGPVTRLKAAVAPDKLFFGFYEELFDMATIRRLTGFLGIAPVEANFARRVGAGPKLALGRADWQAMRDYLAPQYAAMAMAFGTLPAAWGRAPGRG